MTSHNINGTSTPAGPRELREEIERTRADLGETAAALAAKADVKARAKESAAEAADRAKAKAGVMADRVSGEVALTKQQLKDGDVSAVARRPAPVAAIAAVVAAVAAVIYLIRRSRR